MAFLFAGYLILWAITFGYVFSIHSRQQQLQRDLEHVTHDPARSVPASSDTSDQRKGS